MLREYYKRVLAALGYERERPFITRTIRILEENWDSQNLFIIEAPTGYGKSTISATLALRTYEEGSKLIITFPVRTLLEDQYHKLKVLIDDEKVLGKRYMHEHSSPYLIKPITLTTIDTLSLTMFGLAPEDLNRVVRNWDEWTGTLEGTAGHYLFSWSSVMLSDIILDEVHLLGDETKSLTYLIALIKHVIKNDQHIILMSATIPKALESILRTGLLGYKNKINWIKFEEGDDNFVAERRQKNYEIIIRCLDKDRKYDELISWMREGFNEGLNKVLVVFNTVHDAVEFYRKLDGYENRLLIHSRFTSEDRQRKYDRLLELKESNEDFIVVGTQVVEAGIDISSNLLITELAPLNSLIQRFGRFLRYDEKVGRAHIWYEESLYGNAEKYKVYDVELCRKTLSLLQNRTRTDLHIPYGESGYKGLIDAAYENIPRPDDRQIDKMLSTFQDFDRISHAIELFFEMEGSFIRDNLNVLVMTDEMKEPIPIDYALFENLLNNGRVKAMISSGRVLPLDDETRVKFVDSRYAFKNMIRFDVHSFLIEGFYDPEFGLKIGDEDYVDK